MIDITKLLGVSIIDPHSIRYSKGCKSAVHGVSDTVGPVVAWNITQRCNFKCQHCYSSAVIDSNKNELSISEIRQIVEQFKSLKVPVVLLSGGEPFVREDLNEIIQIVKEAGIKISISTNGSLITAEKAKQIKELGVSYVGISLDGIGELNDFFRGVDGAYEGALRGIRNCRAVGQKVGLRMTLHQGNVHEVPKLLELMDREDVDRICFYHLVPSGRGAEIAETMMTEQQSRETLAYLMNYVLENNKNSKEILTVTNHVDGPYLYLLTKEKNPVLAENLLLKLENNKGNRSGIAIMNMDWYGNVYPDQFSKFMPLGNALESSLESIWKEGNEALQQLRDKHKYLNDRCQSCRWLKICGGNLRARAFMTTGDLWGNDPGCYLKDGER